MKIWLDDVREPPDSSWTWCQDSKAAIACLRYCQVEEASLDHDLGLWDTGVAVAEWIASMEKPPKVVKVHSMNPVGAKRLRQILGLE